MYSRIRSSVCIGVEGREVFAETDISKGLPGISVVGLAQDAVMESKERIKSAILNSGFEYPRTKITVNLMPADLRKNSSCLDLPMAVGILASEGIIDAEKAYEYAFIGELALDGSVCSVRGVLPMLMRLREAGISKVAVPQNNIEEAMLSGIDRIYPVSSLSDCVLLIESGNLNIRDDNRISDNNKMYVDESKVYDCDFDEISGQEQAKRAVMVATAGRHGLLMIGSPGCGKSMLAGRIPTIMPKMSGDELIDTAIIRSISGSYSDLSSRIRPFRHPHHTIGPAGLLGGGSQMALPGEITLAHNGVLFLDEICEFNKHIIEGLRIPLEEKSITHFRKGETYKYPCDFQLVMASNPCPCGYYGDKVKECRCTQADIERYQNKLSGPIMDRIDMKIQMERVSYKQLTSDTKGMSSEEMRNAVVRARDFAKSMGRKGYNSDLKSREMEECCYLGDKEKSFMKDAYASLSMSPRTYVRTLRVSRTIADLDESKEIKERHLAEALSYRM